jgi:hypothetical protein
MDGEQCYAVENEGALDFVEEAKLSAISWADLAAAYQGLSQLGDASTLSRDSGAVVDEQIIPMSASVIGELYQVHGFVSDLAKMTPSAYRQGYGN